MSFDIRTPQDHALYCLILKAYESTYPVPDSKTVSPPIRQERGPRVSIHRVSASITGLHDKSKKQRITISGNTSNPNARFTGAGGVGQTNSWMT